MDRRSFLSKTLLATGSLLFKGNKAVHASLDTKITTNPKTSVYRALNGGPVRNMHKIFELMGGISTVFGKDDVIVIKPNLQWWNQGAPNFPALKSFIDVIMHRPGGFIGEVVIAENVHRGAQPWKSEYSSWACTFERNTHLDDVLNMNQLANSLKETYGERFSVCHLINVKDGGRRIYSPEDGTGYVFCDGTGGVPLLAIDNGLRNEDYRATIMTYPIIKTDRGTLIDFKYGIWENDQYINQPFRLINFAAINHHSSYCGITSAIKNYMGISDLSGGPDPFDDGKLTDTYYNFHSFPFNKWAPGPEPGMMGAEMGEFMRTIRKADLNIATGELVGLVSRTEPPVAKTNVILASTDPVSLDYHSAKYVLYPNSKIWFHHPDMNDSPTHQYLKSCAEKMNGEFDEKHVKVNSFDFNSSSFQSDDQLEINADIEWGSSTKQLFKYAWYRIGLT
jgi:hypothetical protein